MPVRGGDDPGWWPDAITTICLIDYELRGLREFRRRILKLVEDEFDGTDSDPYVVGLRLAKEKVMKIDREIDNEEKEAVKYGE